MKPVLLCVDDEQMILESLQMQLVSHFKESVDYEFANSAQDALEIIAELESRKVASLVIITDWLMPGMKGDEMLVQIERSNRNIEKIVAIMLTGQASSYAIERAKKEGALHKCLYKPWNSIELIKVIEDSFDKKKGLP